MLEAYSINQTIATNGILPFNSVSLKKGKTAVLSGVSSIELNCSGVYEIVLDVGGLPGAAGNIEIVMTKDGVQQSQSMISIPTVVATEGIHGSITTLVQATKNNGTCCCSSPTTIQFLNTGVELTQATINVVVTKLC
mgnify:FL=1